MSECLLCSAMSTQNDAEADACRAGDSANMHKYGLHHGGVDDDDDANTCRPKDTIVTKYLFGIFSIFFSFSAPPPTIMFIVVVFFIKRSSYPTVFIEDCLQSSF